MPPWCLLILGRHLIASTGWCVFNYLINIIFHSASKISFFSHLNNRLVTYVDLLEFITVVVCQGCPQGSVLAPHIWNFYFNDILYLNNDQSFLQAYADDLALLVVDDSRKKLEIEVSASLDVLYNKLKEMNLDMASEKTLAVVFRGTQNENKQKKGLTTFKRPPIFKINGRTIRTVDSLKYLGIFIDNQLSWTEHSLSSKIKIYSLVSNFHSVTGLNWGTIVSLLKHWYLTVIQPSLLFGAAVWGGSFTKQQIKTLFSVRRVVLGSVGLSWVKAHAGIPGNELADQFAKLAITEVLNKCCLGGWVLGVPPSCWAGSPSPAALVVSYVLTGRPAVVGWGVVGWGYISRA
ncbi:hypothetical protein AVEN_6661-1 [Araneus ventricosus]|uniref:Reverse transcriptase domain-containing protein n=1 Tax=Araneus ventricosus TaxID=182803 RepID=A0A4Y2JXT9_ARAVE|nr:hypothetical protein AVEN_6661-1 [Araneus ventricosus]